MPAIHDEIVEAEEEGVGFEFLIQPVKVSLLKNKKLAVRFQRMKLRDPDQSGRPKAIPVKGKFLTLEADHLITAVGEQVDLSWIPQDLIKNGLIDVNPSHRRSLQEEMPLTSPEPLSLPLPQGRRRPSRSICI